MRLPNDEQLKVIENLDENIILFASAGTGKTFTVANRVANIIKSGRAKPQEILCLTFTIKACGEMREDITRYIGAEAKEVVVKTIHGFCYHLLAEEHKRSGERYNDLHVCDEVDEEELLRSILSTRYYAWRGVVAVCPACGREHTQRNETCEACGEALGGDLPLHAFKIYEKKNALMNFVSAVKHCREENNFYLGDEYADLEKTVAFLREHKQTVFEDGVSYYAKYMGKVPDEEFALAMQAFGGRLVLEYDEHLRQSNQVDFDDLVVQVNGLLGREEIATRWTKRYKYVIVDEMQDTSVLEYEVLKKIFAANNVMLCGDFFQTIYEWRGSRPREVLSDYIDRFKAKSYTLSENYRATKTLARAGFGYLEKTYPELLGKFCPATMRVNSSDEGEKIFCYAFDNRKEEARQIFKFIKRRKDKDQICVMARTNKYIAALAREFEEINAALPESEQVRFFTVEENYQFFKKPVVKDILAVIKLLLNGDDRVSMERLAEKYIRGVGGRTIETLRSFNGLGVAITSFIDGALHTFGDTYYPLIKAYQEGNIVVYDTETTGLELAKDEMVQLSAIRLGKGGEIVDTLDMMIEPSVPIGQGAYETHGFDLAYIRSHDGVSAKTALEKFSAFCKGCVLVGHNSLRFDSPLIQRQLRENGLPVLSIVGEYDTMTIAKQFHSKLPDFKLATLCFYYGIVNDAAHNALGDITATAKCLVKMLVGDILPSEEERRGVFARYKEKFEKFYAFVQELRGLLKRGDTAGLAVFAIEKMMMQKRYKTHADNSAMRDIVEGLRVGAGEGEGEGAEGFLRAYITDATLSSSQLDEFLKRTDRVPVITVHQAKGCEFNTVLLAGVDENNFPSFAARQSGEEEEEKKVFYVAITRAKSRLILTRAIYNGRNESKPSPYVAAIPAEYLVTNRIWSDGE